MTEAVEDTLVEVGGTLAVEEAAMIATNRRKNLEGNMGPSLSVFKSTF
jgi:divalent metal cation (Fe/Co/Zn/Cd) transporter